MGGWSERVMGQKGFFDVERRLEAISALGDPLETIKKIVPWEDFRTDIEAVTETKPEERKSNAGRKPYDTILKFKIMVLQSLHNLSDDRTGVPDPRPHIVHALSRSGARGPGAGCHHDLAVSRGVGAGRADRQAVERFGQHLEAEGYIARGGQIIDATIVSVPKQRNTKEENETIKPARRRRMGAAARQECPEGQGRALDEEERRELLRLQEPPRVDKAHKLIRKWDATDASVHDSQTLDDVLDLSNTGKGLGGQRLPLVQIEAGLKAKGLQSHIHRRAARNRPLSERQKSANTTRSRCARAVSSTYSATSRTRWAARSCAPSASRGRGLRSG